MPRSRQRRDAARAHSPNTWAASERRQAVDVERLPGGRRLRRGSTQVAADRPERLVGGDSLDSHLPLRDHGEERSGLSVVGIFAANVTRQCLGFLDSPRLKRFRRFGEGSGESPGPLGLGGSRCFYLLLSPPLGEQALQVELGGKLFELRPPFSRESSRHGFGSFREGDDALGSNSRFCGERLGSEMLQPGRVARRACAWTCSAWCSVAATASYRSRSRMATTRVSSSWRATAASVALAASSSARRSARSIGASDWAAGSITSSGMHSLGRLRIARVVGAGRKVVEAQEPRQVREALDDSRLCHEIGSSLCAVRRRGWLSLPVRPVWHRRRSMSGSAGADRAADRSLSSPAVWLELDRDEHAAAAGLVDRESDALLGQDGQHLVHRELAAVHLQGEPDQREVSTIRAARQLVAAGELPIGDDHLLDEYGDACRKLRPERATQAAQAGLQVSFDRSAPRAVLDQNLHRNRATLVEIRTCGTAERRQRSECEQPEAMAEMCELLHGGGSQASPPVRRMADSWRRAGQLS